MEGWLLYYAGLAYRRGLFHEPHPTLRHPQHRKHYVDRYFQTALDPVRKPMIHMGYKQAQDFAEVVGEERLEQVTLLVARLC